MEGRRLATTEEIEAFYLRAMNKLRDPNFNREAGDPDIFFSVIDQWAEEAKVYIDPLRESLVNFEFQSSAWGPIEFGFLFMALDSRNLALADRIGKERSSS